MKNFLPVLFLFFAAGITAQTFTSYKEADGLAGDNVSSVVTDKDGTAYFGTNNGVSIFDGTTWTTYNPVSYTHLTLPTICSV